MAIPVWPFTNSVAQRFQRDGYSRGAGDGRQFSPMGQGPAKARRRYSAVVRPISGSFIFSTNELARFERFWDEDTDGGVLPFLIIDAVNHDQPLLTDEGDVLTTEAGIPLLISAWWIVMFGQDAWSADAIGGDTYRVSMQLSVMP
ncbi:MULTISPECIES: hypothetical protein [Aurantimonas]|uniref:hypothetical protein n=1 Tax=Aurantimonas TaxID=182269 RepID=UPI0035129825